jgi:hypothetical protein
MPPAKSHLFSSPFRIFGAPLVSATQIKSHAVRVHLQQKSNMRKPKKGNLSLNVRLCNLPSQTRGAACFGEVASTAFATPRVALRNASFRPHFTPNMNPRPLTRCGSLPNIDPSWRNPSL